MFPLVDLHPVLPVHEEYVQGHQFCVEVNFMCLPKQRHLDLWNSQDGSKVDLETLKNHNGDLTV